MEDIIFIRSNPLASPRVVNNSDISPQRRIKPRVEPAHIVTSDIRIDLASSKSSGNKSGPTQSAKEETQSRLEYVENFLVQEKKSMADYIAKLEKSLKRKHDGLIIGDDFLHQRIAILKAQNDRQQAFYRTETDVLRQRNTRLEAEKAALQGNGPVFDDEIRDLRTVKATLEDRVSVLENENQNLIAEVSKLTEEFNEQKKLIEEMEAASAHSEPEVHMLRQQNAALTTEKEKLAGNASMLSKEIEHLRADMSSLKENLNEQKMRYEQARAAANTLHQQNSALSAEKNTIEHNVFEVEEELQNLRAEISRLTSTLRAQKVLTKKATTAHAPKTVSTTLPKNKKLDRKAKEKERRIQTLLASHADLEATHASTVTHLRASLAAKNEHVQALHTGLDLKSQQNETLAFQKSRLEQALKDRSAQVIQLSREVEVSGNLKDELQRAHDDAGETNARLQRNARGMYVHYRILHKKNKKLVKKLTRVAAAGGVKRYARGKRVERLKGVPLKELEEFRGRVK